MTFNVNTTKHIASNNSVKTKKQNLLFCINENQITFGDSKRGSLANT